MNNNTSIIPSWIIWSFALLTISLAFMIYLFYSPSSINSSNLTTQHKLIINKNTTDSSDISMILNMQKQLMLEINAVKESNEKNINEILLIKKAHDILQQSTLNNDKNNSQHNMLTENKIESPDVTQETEKTMKIQQQKYIQSIDEYFVSQNEDSIWTNQVTDDFETAFYNYSDQLTLHDVSCGGSICKINASINTEQLSTDNPVQLDRLINGDAKWTGQSFYELNTETGSVIVYLMREGEEFPQVN